MSKVHVEVTASGHVVIDFERGPAYSMTIPEWHAFAKADSEFPSWLREGIDLQIADWCASRKPPV